MCGVENGRVAVPGRNFRERISADDEENLQRCQALGVESAERVVGVRRAVASQFQIGHLPLRVVAGGICQRQPHHLQPMILGRPRTVSPMRWARCRDEPDGVKCECLLSRARGGHVAVVNRIEGPAEQAHP